MLPGNDTPGRAVVPRIVDLVLDRPPRLGVTRLVCIDGPAGSGKTTLASEVERELTRRARSVEVVHMDDLYEGWTGLDSAEERVQQWLVEPLRDGREAAYRRYDWDASAYAERHALPPVDVLVLEGVGSGCSRHAGHLTLLVWVEAPVDVRLERGLARDGTAMEEHWRRWMVQEAQFHAEDLTRERADLLVDGGASRRVSRPTAPGRPEEAPADRPSG